MVALNFLRSSEVDAITRKEHRLKQYSNIVVGPYQELMDIHRGLSFHRGGPVWPDWDTATDVRHCRDNVPFDHKPTYAAADIKGSIGNVYWGGAIVKQYGHQIADFSTRILGYNNYKSSHKLGFSVHPRDGISNVAEAPGYFQEILKWYGIDQENVVIFNEPLLVKNLICCPQEEQLGSVGPSGSYLQSLTKNARRNLRAKGPKKDTYFISRVTQKNGRIAGEFYLEYIFGINGVKVIRPENLSLFEQLRIYSSARKLIFSEGSALHSLQLLGRGIGELHVVNRRVNNRLIRASLGARCRGLHYHDVGQLITGLNAQGKPARPLGINVPAETGVKELFAKVGVKMKGWSSSLFDSCVRNDIERWWEFEQKSRRRDIPGSIEHISRQLKELDECFLTEAKL